MKLNEFIKFFFGAFIGVLIYELTLDLDDTFQNYWFDYIFEIAVTAIFVFLGIMVVNLGSSKFFPSSDKEETE